MLCCILFLKSSEITILQVQKNQKVDGQEELKRGY